MNCSNLKILLEKAVSFLLTVKNKIKISVFYNIPVSTDFSSDLMKIKEDESKKITVNMKLSFIEHNLQRK